jgi:cytochrome P450
VQRVRTAVGDEAWLVTGYELVREFLDDKRLGRAHRDPASAARTGHSAIFGGPLGDFDTEHADHARMRALLRPYFAPARMRRLRPRVEALTAGLLDALEEHGSPGDLHDGLALPLPILVICELLGVPYADRERFRGWSEQAGDVGDAARSEEGLGLLFAYGLELVARKRAQPGQDVLSGLVATEGVSDEEAAMLGMSLLFAGHETTVRFIGHGLLQLLTHPEQMRALRTEATRIPTAVEEILRSPAPGGNGIPRYAREDFDLAGIPIAAGELVIFDTAAGNHDPAAFTDPDRFDAARSEGAHLSFGHGARYCLGAPLARIELQVVYESLLPRLPTLRLAVDLDQVPLRTGVLTGGVHSLPVEW